MLLLCFCSNLSLTDSAEEEKDVEVKKLRESKAYPGLKSRNSEECKAHPDLRPSYSERVNLIPPPSKESRKL